jgi:hypothetical protein
MSSGAALVLWSRISIARLGRRFETALVLSIELGSSPSLLIPETERTGPRSLSTKTSGAEVIAAHILDSVAGQHALALERAPIKQHPSKAQVVRRGR